MLLAEVIQKCVVFLCGRPDGGPLCAPSGTAFFVGVYNTGPCPMDELPGVYLVTAAHVVDDLVRFNRMVIKASGSHGQFTPLEVSPAEWQVHPSGNVDLAILPFNDIAEKAGLSHDCFPNHWLATSKRISDVGIGPGDRVLLPGLFHQHSGKQQIQILLRGGIVAMLANPNEPLQINGEDVPAHLIEALSFGGLSGAPVVVQLVGTRRGNETNGPQIGGSDDAYLLGLIRGRWKNNFPPTNEKEKSESHLNPGIAIVTPAQFISDMLFSDQFVRERRERCKRQKDRNGTLVCLD